MTIGDVLTSARVAAEALMVDTCTVEHQSGSTLYDDGRDVPTYTTLYTGPCRVQMRGGGSQALRDVGDQQVSLLTIEVQLPMSVVGVTVRDLITIDSSAHDLDLVGREFRVADLFHKSHASSRRLPCVEVTA